MLKDESYDALRTMTYLSSTNWRLQLVTESGGGAHVDVEALRW